MSAAAANAMPGSSWDAAFDDELAALSRNAPARQPATLGEVWAAEWDVAGLDTTFGVSEPRSDAYGELVEAMTGALGRPIGVVAEERGLSLGGGGFRGAAETMAQLAATLPEAERKRIEPLLDVEANARAKARAIEAKAADVSSRTYGLGANTLAFAAGIARAAVDPINLAAAPLGGPLTGSVPRMLAREFLVGAGAQAVQEPFVQSGRAELGLDAGLDRALTNIVTAGVGGATLSGLLRAGAWAARGGLDSWRASQGARLDATDAPGIPDAGRVTDIRLSPDDLDALALRVERDELMDSLSVDPTPEGRLMSAEQVEAMTRALEAGRFDAFDVPDTDARSSPASAADLVEDVADEPAPQAAPQKSGTPSDPRPLGAAPSSNYKVRLSEYSDRLYREIGPDDLELWLPTGKVTGKLDEVFFSHRRDLALGQAKNQGIVLEVDPDGWQGTINQKPMWQLAWQGGDAEFRATQLPGGPGPRGSLLAVEVRPTAWANADRRAVKIATQRALDALEGAGWSKSTLADGTIRYERGGSPAKPAAAAPAKRRRAEPKPLSLVQFIARNGGLALDGDARAADYQRAFVPRGGPLARQSGRSIDGYWREALIEQGYLPADPDGGVARDISKELFDAIDRELGKGGKTYREQDLRAVEEGNAGGALDSYAVEVEAEAKRVLDAHAEFGIDRDAIDSRSLYEAAEMLAWGDETDPVMALERAFLARIDDEAELSPDARSVYGDDLPGWDDADGNQGAATREDGRSPGGQGQGSADGRPAQRAAGDGGDGARPGEGAGQEGLETQSLSKLPTDPDAIDRAARAADVERALADAGGDMDVILVDPATGTERRVSARQLLDDAKADEQAAAELADCILRQSGEAV